MGGGREAGSQAGGRAEVGLARRLPPQLRDPCSLSRRMPSGRLFFLITGPFKDPSPSLTLPPKLVLVPLPGIHLLSKQGLGAFPVVGPTPAQDKTKSLASQP